MRLHFDAAGIRRLLDHSIAAKERDPTFDQLFSAACRKDRKNVRITDGPEMRWPEAEDVDPTRVPAGITLVGDRGIYACSNGRPPLRPDGKDTGLLAVFARECDPEKLEFDDWWSTKNLAWGGDDGTLAVPRDLVEAMLRTTIDGWCHLDVTPKGVSVVNMLASPKGAEPARKPRRKKT